MSVFDVAKNNRGNDEIGIYTSYARFDEYLRMAQAEERERIVELLKDKCECTERMLADAWSPQGQTLFCKWHKLIHEIKGDSK